MPFNLQIVPDENLAVLDFTGSVFGATVTDAIQKLLLDPGWRTDYVTLVDLRLIDELVLVPDDVKSFERVIRLLQPLIGPSRTAVVAQREVVHMAASLYAEQAMEVIVDHEIGVFREVHDAFSWLNITPRQARVASDPPRDGEGPGRGQMM